MSIPGLIGGEQMTNLTSLTRTGKTMRGIASFNQSLFIKASNKRKNVQTGKKKHQKKKKESYRKNERIFFQATNYCTRTLKNILLRSRDTNAKLCVKETKGDFYSFKGMSLFRKHVLSEVACKKKRPPVSDILSYKKSDCLPDIECLRTSPKRTSKRRQSPSPVRRQNQGDERLQTPTKGHTPRKDTPTKKRPKYQCRISGCADFFVDAKGRVRHENSYCRFRQGIDPVVSLEKQFVVPDHTTLQLDPCHCRAPNCKKTYGTVAARKKHELEKHRYFEVKGRTVSPILYERNEYDEVHTIRPSSCPPFSAESNTPRSRSRQSLYVSSSNESVNLLQLESPNITLSSLSDQSVSSSSLQSLDSLDDDRKCTHCLVNFTSRRGLERHNCMFEPNDNVLSTLSYVELKRPINWRKTQAIIKQLCSEDQVRLCIINNWCLPSIYPFCFPYNYRSGRFGNIPILKEMTALTSSTELLHKMTKSNEKVSLPKRILVKDEESGTTAYFPEKILKPSRKFDYNETEDSYIVTNFIDSIAVNEETDIDDASSEDSSENSDDLDDITYEFPKQYSHDMADEFELEPSAPSHATEIVGSPVLAETICSSVEANDSDLNGGALGNQSYCVNEESDINDNRINNNIDINDNTFLDPDLLNLLPENFDRGYDGMGASFM